MAEDDPGATAFDAVTRNHEEIRRWVRQRGGRPVADADDDDPAGLGLRFPDEGTDDAEPIGWEAFFDRFEAAGLAFAHEADGGPSARPDCALLRSADDAAAGGPEPREVWRRADPGTRGGVDAEAADAAARARAARDDANADLHRDEPPFEG